MKPQDRRLAAIDQITNNWGKHLSPTSSLHSCRATIAQDIRNIARLGRTERWHFAVEWWASNVEAAETEDWTRWAFYQYAIYAAHRA